MIEWLRRVDSDRPFLRYGDATWTYGHVVNEVEARMVDVPRLIQPTLTPPSVFDLVAAIAGGGATVVGPEPEVTEPGKADLVVFTSGTTGRPKGVRLTILNLAAAAAASAEHLGHGPDDRWLLAMPLHHVGGLSIVVRQAYTGGAIVMLPGFDAPAFAAAMQGDVTMVSVVPTMLARLLDHAPFQRLRAVLVGGGPIPSGLLEKATAAGLPVLPTYGMTETFGQVATLRPGEPLGYKAHPLPGIELRTDPEGRISVKGAQVSPGYLDESDRPGRWFVTNDLGEIEDDGAIRVLGRTDSVIVSGGENVAPERVEAVLGSHPGVRDVVVVGVPHAEWGEIAVCVFEGDAAGLEEWAAKRLPSVMVPKRWCRVDSLPATSLGKPDREAARRLIEDLSDVRAEGDVEADPDED